MPNAISAALLAHYARVGSSNATLAHCIRFVRGDDVEFHFTGHDEDIVIAGWGGPYAPLVGTYEHASAYNLADVASGKDLAPDNTEATGLLDSNSITEDDLTAGLWDYAAFTLFQVNYGDLSQGPRVIRAGWLGEVSTGRADFVAELRGLLQALSRTIGIIASPACRHTLGDERCQVDLTGGSQPLTVTGTIDDVATDNLTMYDAERTEAGPTGGKAISGVSATDPAVVTATAHGFIEGQFVAISGVIGPGAINTIWQVHNPTTDTFEVPLDASALTSYSSGGTASAFSDSGWFDNGVITMTSGENAGLSREIKSYVPGQWTLQLPFPYPIATGSGGDTYSMVPGCDKLHTTCIDKFDNIVNFGGLPFVRGTDALVQVGRHS